MASQTLQKDFDALTIDIIAEAEEGLDLSSPHGWTAAESSSISLVVDRQRPYKIREPSPEWLTLFGFTPVQVLGRAMRICQGPQTNAKALAELIEGANSNPLSMEFTFYTNSGDELTLHVSVRPHESDESLCSLIMEDEATPVLKEKSTKVPNLVLSAEAPFNVVSANKHFLKYFDVLEADVFEQGASAIFCAQTEGMRWRNLITTALSGANSECIMSTNRGDDTSRMSRIQVVPVYDKFGRNVEQLSFKFYEPPVLAVQHHDLSDGYSTSTESFASFASSEAETRTDAQRIASAFSRVPSHETQALMTHLRAMKAARKKRLSEESIESINS